MKTSPLSPCPVRDAALSLAAAVLVFGLLGCGGNALATKTAGGGSGGQAGAAGDAGGAGGVTARGSGGATTDAGGGIGCIAAPPRLPHISATGTRAAAIGKALDAIFAAQAPPLALGPAYTIASLGCDDGAWDCSLQVDTGGPQPTAVTTMNNMSLGQALFNALGDAGAMPCQSTAGKGGTVDDMFLRNVSVTASEVQFDDASAVNDYVTQNVTARGADAQSILQAFKTAGIDDCDPKQNVFIICNGSSDASSCGYQWLLSGDIGGSHSCSELTAQDGGDVGPDGSRAIWRSLLTAAQDAGYQSPNGPLTRTSTINARFFVWDGTTVRFWIETGDAGPSP